MKYFKIMRGFGENDFIPIDETELEKAIYAQIVGNIVATFQNGSIMGNHISSIMPDFHRAMGWNYGYKMGADDHDQIMTRGASAAYRGVIGLAKDRVNYFITTDQKHLIGTGAGIPAANVGMIGDGTFVGPASDLVYKKKIS